MAVFRKVSTLYIVNMLLVFFSFFVYIIVIVIDIIGETKRKSISTVDTDY